MIGNICNDYISTRNNSKTALKLFLSSVINSLIIAIALLSLAISCFHQLSGTIIAFRSELRIDPDVKFFLLDYIQRRMRFIMKIGILGSGDVGRRLADGFIELGHTVKIGSRDPNQGKITEWIAKHNEGKASAGTFAETA